MAAATIRARASSRPKRARVCSGRGARGRHRIIVDISVTHGVTSPQCGPWRRAAARGGIRTPPASGCPRRPRGADRALAASLLRPPSLPRPSAAGRRRQGRPAQHPRRDDRRHGDHRRQVHAERAGGCSAKQGTTFADAVDSFPLCCPARATFITGQYAHNHGVGGNFYPYGWYGMKDRGNTLPAWLQNAGYRTALIGKWLNGYGARDAHGEVPTRVRHLARTARRLRLRLLQLRDEQQRRAATWGDAEFARKLVEFANIEVTPEPGRARGRAGEAERGLRAPRRTRYWGTTSPRTTRRTSPARSPSTLVERSEARKKPFFIWWAPAAPHREDVATTLMGRPGPDPRPAPSATQARASGFTLPRPPSFNEADVTDKAVERHRHAAPLTQAADRSAPARLPGARRARCAPSTTDVGQLVETLPGPHQLQNTLIIFTSDNGWLQGEHRIPGDKFLPYEESLRVPLILRGPGMPTRPDGPRPGREHRLRPDPRSTSRTRRPGARWTGSR